jgi:hypothetical protein
MSYCRWGPDSDVYLFMAADDQLHCCHCGLSLPGTRTDFVAKDHRDMLSHLVRHVEGGHRIPAEAIATLESEAEDPTSRRTQ